MALGSWKKIRQSMEIRNPWWTYRKDDVLLPSGAQGEYHFVHVKGSSMIIPVLADGRLLLLNQYRYLANRESVEFPCGSVKEESTYDLTAVHELAEETGCRADLLECAAEFNPYNGVTDEVCKVYIARGLSPAAASPDETEEFEQIQITPREFDAMVVRGEIWDGMTLAAWALTKHRFSV